MAIATMGVTVLDCPDPRRLAEFYAGVLGWRILEDRSDSEWVELGDTAGTRRLAFQESAGYVPPEWPSLEHAQQLHLDFDVPTERWDEAEREVIEAGARLVQGDEGKRDFRVYLDPVGHPFCLCAK
ncbi:VOC family protein [Streptomyces sp. NPDC048172]|uniref:VOC family protein n=1 Tax=Streptomyces sp. NPDC048172 TaxID=3365505 RepID=UPI003713F202